MKTFQKEISIGLVLLCLIALTACTASPQASPAPSDLPPANTATTIQPSPPQPTPAQPTQAQPAPAGEKYSVDAQNGKWSYSCDDYSIDITKIQSDKLKLTYFLADIKISNFDVIQSGFSSRAHPGYSPGNPTKTAANYNAVYAQNGDWFYHPANKQGMCIRNGITFYDKEQQADTLAFLPDLTIQIYRPGETTVLDLLKSGVKDTISFGPMLVRDGKVNEDLPKSHIYDPYARSGFGMTTKSHFIGIVTEGFGVDDSRGITLDEFAQLFLSHGCNTAYNLDGGPSAAMIFMGKMLNRHRLSNGKTYTAVPDILIIGTTPSVKGN